MQILSNSGNKVNVINFVYAKKPAFCIRQTNVRAQKIDKSYLKIFQMIIASFFFQNKLKKI